MTGKLKPYGLLAPTLSAHIKAFSTHHPSPPPPLTEKEEKGGEIRNVKMACTKCNNRKNSRDRKEPFRRERVSTFILIQYARCSYSRIALLLFLQFIQIPAFSTTSIYTHSSVTPFHTDTVAHSHTIHKVLFPISLEYFPG